MGGFQQRPNNCAWKQMGKASLQKTVIDKSNTPLHCRYVYHYTFVSYPYLCIYLLLAERQTRDRKVASSNSGRDNRRTFFFQGQLCLLTLILCPFHPRVTAVARKRPGHSAKKCRWQATPRHAYTRDATKSEWAV